MSNSWKTALVSFPVSMSIQPTKWVTQRENVNLYFGEPPFITSTWLILDATVLSRAPLQLKSRRQQDWRPKLFLLLLWNKFSEVLFFFFCPRYVLACPCATWKLISHLISVCPWCRHWPASLCPLTTSWLHWPDLERISALKYFNVLGQMKENNENLMDTYDYRSFLLLLHFNKMVAKRLDRQIFDFAKQQENCTMTDTTVCNIYLFFWFKGFYVCMLESTSDIL